MKTVFIPLYMPVPYSGATPQPYQSSIVDGFERKLVAIFPGVIRTEVMRLLPSVDGRFVSQQPARAYQWAGDADPVLSLSLKQFTLPSVSFADEDGFLYSAKLDDLGEVEYREVKADE